MDRWVRTGLGMVIDGGGSGRLYSTRYKKVDDIEEMALSQIMTEASE